MPIYILQHYAIHIHITIELHKTTQSNEKMEEKHKNVTNYDDVDNNDYDDEMREQESSVGGTRWNPTKEQIDLLERIYSHEGVRTPSADQIRQITTRLRVYGHIEGKNVFYWFQNHKARQRQKQKLQRLANANANANSNINVNYHLNHTINHINRFVGHAPPTLHQCINNLNNSGYNNGVHLHHPNPMFPSPPLSPHSFPPHYLPNPNVISNSYYKLPQPTNEIGFHAPHYNYNTQAAEHQHALMKRSQLTSNHGCNYNPIMEMPPGGGVQGPTLNGYCAAMMNTNGHYDNHRGRDMIGCMGTRTLDLFPVHPTGILEHKFGMSSTNNSAANSSGGSSSSDTNTFGDEKHQRLFDFFSSGHAPCESN